jgi:hypothetical protein
MTLRNFNSWYDSPFAGRGQWRFMSKNELIKRNVRLSNEDINNLVTLVRREKERVNGFKVADCDSMIESKIHALLYLDMLINKLELGKI